MFWNVQECLGMYREVREYFECSGNLQGYFGMFKDVLKCSENVQGCFGVFRDVLERS